MNKWSSFLDYNREVIYNCSDIRTIIKFYEVSVSKSRYAKIETDRTHIRVKELVALRRIFKCSFNDFFDGLDELLQAEMENTNFNSNSQSFQLWACHASYTTGRWATGSGWSASLNIKYIRYAILNQTVSKLSFWVEGEES